jgi:uncharacterized protein
MSYRIYKVKDLRMIAAQGGQALAGLVAYVNTMRRFQSNEGITLLDSEDDFVPQSINVQSGISDALVQFGQQLSGALQIPLVRLFGQSPAGLNSSGESDLRTYYDNITQQQESHLRVPLTNIVEVVARSEGIELPHDQELDFDFCSLWEMTEDQKSSISQRDVATVMQATEGGLIDRTTALKELRQLSTESGRFTNIDDKMIADAEGPGLPDVPILPGLEGLLGDGKGEKPAPDVPIMPGLEGILGGDKTPKTEGAAPNPDPGLKPMTAKAA